MQEDETNKISTARQSEPILEFPDKIYGRLREQKTLDDLLDLFEQGHPSFIHVRGASGIGKSFFLYTYFKNQSNYYYHYGKYERFQQGIPFVGISQVIESVINRLLKEDSSQEEIKSAFVDTFASYYWEIRSVLPSLSTYLPRSEKKRGQNLSPMAWKNRIMKLFIQMIRFGSENSHKRIIMHIDDLQWSDYASIEFLEQLVSENIEGVLLAIANRTEKSSLDPRFESLVRKISQKSVVETIELRPLRLENVVHMLSELFPTTNSEIQDLAQVAFEKSAGVPYILNEYLRHLRHRKQIVFDTDIHAWNWNVTEKTFKNPEVPLTGILTQKLNELAPSDQRIIQKCSCFGSHLNIPLISQITGIEKEHLQDAFAVAERRDFIRKVQMDQDSEQSMNYEFVHDILQTALHNSLPRADRMQLHRDIADFYMTSSIIGLDKRDVFEAAYHYNESVGMERTEAEKVALTKINLRAAEKALESASFHLALIYVQRALENKVHQRWKSDYGLASKTHILGYQIARLNGRIELANNLFKAALSHCQKQDVALIRSKRLVLDIQNGELESAIKSGVRALKDLGISVPLKADKFSVGKEFIRTKVQLRGISLEDIYELPELKDENAEMATRIIFWMYRAAYAINPELNGVLALKQLQLTLKYGTNGDSFSGLMAYGVIIAAASNNCKVAFEFGEVGRKIAEKYGVESGALDFGKAVYTAFTTPIGSTIELYHTAKVKSNEAGDLLGAAEPTANEVLTHFQMGSSLNEVNKKVNENLELCDYLQAKDFYDFQQMMQYHLKQLRGEGMHFGYEREIEELIERTQYGVIKGVSAIMSMIELVINGKYKEALKISSERSKEVQLLTGLQFQTDYYFLRAYCLMMTSQELNFFQRNGVRRKTKSIIRKMSKWAECCIENHGQKLSVIIAMLEMDKKNYDAAQSTLHRASQQNGFNTYLYDALAHRAAAKVQLLKGNESEYLKLNDQCDQSLTKWGYKEKAQFSGK